MNKVKNFFNATKKMYNDFRQDYYDCKKEFGNDLLKWTPNILTSMRISLLPVIAVLGIMGNNLITGILAGITLGTDGIDGFIARRFNCKSEFGRKFDALSDKLLGTLLTLLVIPTMPIFLVSLALELGITLINWNAEKKNLSPKTHQIGRIKTVLLGTTLVASILSPEITILKSIIPTLLGSTLTLQALTMTQYYNNLKKNKKEVVDFKSITSENINNEPKEINNKEYLKNYKQSLNIEEKDIEKVKKL